MKFVYFHFMPYDRLPEDFSSRYRSSWVDIPPELCDPRRIHHLYHEYLDTLEYADARGFDAIGVNEHHSNAYGLMANPGIMASTLARRTSDAAILVMGDSIPLYQPAIRVAEELAMVDVLSGGRLIAGFPVGSSQDTNFAYGIDPATTRDRYLEGVELVKRGWTSQEVFSFNGRYTKLRYVNPWPKPLQRPHPPIWAPGSGSLETFDFAVEQDIPYCFLSFFGAEFAEGNMRRYWERVEAGGRDLNPYRAGMVQAVFVADTDAEAERLYERHVQYFFQRCVHIYPGFTEAPGYKSVESLKAVVPPKGAATTGRRDSFAAARDYKWKDFVDSGIVIAGSPATVRDRLRDAATRLNTGNWILLMHIGDLPGELARYNIDLFTEQVAPHLRDVFPGAEHRWWSQPLPLGERATPAPVSNVAVASR